MKTILVTGSSGYIGSVLTEQLLQQGLVVIGVDKDNPLSDRLIFHNIDIQDYHEISCLIKSCRPDAVIHLAGMRGEECDRNPISAYEVNFKGTASVAQAADQHGVKKFLFASTCSNYGVMSKQDEWLNEDSPLTPVSSYAISKVAAENWLAGGYLKNTKAVVFRFATAFGVSPNMRYDLLINHFVRDCVHQKTLEVFQPQVWRPFCHVEDISTACIAAVQTELRGSFEIFNVGSNRENYTKQQIIDLLEAQFTNLSYCLNSQNQDPRNYKVDFSKINKQLGFRTNYSLLDGIKQLTSYERNCKI